MTYCALSPFGLSRDIALELRVAGFQNQPVGVSSADIEGSAEALDIPVCRASGDPVLFSHRLCSFRVAKYYIHTLGKQG